ncbi:carboxymuconolactone decarboxylase family protein [Tersicoccus sp. MR15.9]|uniref:carboxymuconolactone decarboxylase family protein n=1 Tax=Tersicoccus mangrovi TaxID=3121635 RepID=UPI002FE68EB2
MNRRLGDADALQRSAAGQELLRRFTGGDRAGRGTDFSLVDADGRLTGPPAVWQLSPDLGLALEPLGHTVRFSLTLSRRTQEIVVLTVARAEDSDFERWAHVRAGRAAGLSEEEIAALLDGEPQFSDTAEEAAHELARRLVTGAPLDDAAFDAAVDALGRQAVAELVTLVGYYRMIALQLRAFDVRPPS